MNIFSISDKFEFDWLWYIQSQGFLVRQSLPITADSGVEDATDVDVWGIRFLPPMIPSIAVVDCKNKQKPKTYERILWTKGMALHVGADLAFVGAPAPNWKVIDFGRSCGIHVAPHAHIDRHLRSLQPERRAYGQARFDIYRDFFARKKATLKARTDIGERLYAARNLYRIGSPLTNVNRALDYLVTCMDHWEHSHSQPEVRSLWLFVCCEVIVAFGVNLLKAASEAFNLPEEDRRGLVSRRLTYGDMQPRKAEDIFRHSHWIAIEYARSVLPPEDRAKIPDSPLAGAGLGPPDYAPAIAGIIERIAQNPLLYWDSLRLLDGILFDFVAPARDPSGEGLAAIGDPSSLPLLLKAAKNMVSVACSSADVPRDPFWVHLGDGSTDPAASSEPGDDADRRGGLSGNGPSPSVVGVETPAGTSRPPIGDGGTVRHRSLPDG